MRIGNFLMMGLFLCVGFSGCEKEDDDGVNQNNEEGNIVDISDSLPRIKSFSSLNGNADFIYNELGLLTSQLVQEYPYPYEYSYDEENQLDELIFGGQRFLYVVKIGSLATVEVYGGSETNWTMKKYFRYLLDSNGKISLAFKEDLEGNYSDTTHFYWSGDDLDSTLEIRAYYGNTTIRYEYDNMNSPEQPVIFSQLGISTLPFFGIAEHNITKTLTWFDSYSVVAIGNYRLDSVCYDYEYDTLDLPIKMVIKGELEMYFTYE